MLTNINKSGWTKVPLGDLVVKKEENDKLNAKERFKKFLKVEHLDAEYLHIKRWGNQDEEELPPTFYKIFRKGQILYPTRNPHLKRAAIATFDGICGEKTLTLEPVSELVLPNYLPFLFQSENFINHAVGSIIGSTNPHVRWRDIAKFEFLLPPKNQQAQIAELLWAGDEMIEVRINLGSRLNVVNESLAQAFLDSSLSKNRWPIYKIAELSSSDKHSCVGGPFGSNLTAKDYIESPGVPVIRGTNLNGGLFSFNEEDFVYVSDRKAEDLYNNVAYPNDLIVTQRGTMGQVALIPESSMFKKYIISQSQMKLTVDTTKVFPQYLYYYFLSTTGQNLIKNSVIATGVPHINLGIFKDFKIMVPDLNEQSNFLKRVSSIQNAITENRDSIKSSQAVKKSLINQFF